jgi:hypothetical protein
MKIFAVFLLLVCTAMAFGQEAMVPSNTIISNNPAKEQLCVVRAKAIVRGMAGTYYSIASEQVRRQHVDRTRGISASATYRQ